MRCQLCPYIATNREDMIRHVRRTHKHAKDEERLKAMRANPITYLKEKGFSRELQLISEGRCPRCTKLFTIDENTSTEALREWKKSYLCPECFEELKES